MFCPRATLWWAAFVYTTLVGAQLGNVQTDVPWRAGHAAVYLDPYVILYGGTENTAESFSSGTVHGSTSVWVWDSRNGSWYHAQPQQQAGVTMLPQVYIKATQLPSSGQMITVASNVSSQGGLLQKLDINSWSWSFPSSSTESPNPSAQYAITRVNNTIYTYGGTSVDTNGFMQSNAVLNSLYSLDANSFGWTSGSNGPAITGHATCYIQSCNCLVTFGGTSTGNAADAIQSVYIYDLTSRSWNLQVSVQSGSGGSPGARMLHTANCMSDKMIVYGGGTTQPFDSDVWVLNAANYPTLVWEKVDVSNQSIGPSSRMGHSAVLDSSTGKIYIFGGWGVTATGDSNMYILDTNAWSWTRVSTAGMGTGTDSPGGGTEGGSGGDNAGMIAGAVVGGVGGAALLAAVLLFFLLWRRRQRKKQQERDDQSEKVDNNDHTYYWEEPARYSYADAEIMTPTSPYPRKRVSKAMTSTFSNRDSYNTRRSELGDTDRVMTGVLTELPSPNDTSSEDPLASYSNGTRSPRDSAHASKALLIPECGQVPNEILHQKPNEFSVPASRLAVHKTGAGEIHAVPIEHYDPRSPTSENAPLSSSMEVLRSTTTNNNYGNLTGAVAVMHEPKDEDNTTFNESVSFQAQGPTGPIRYIPGASQQFSLATTTTASANPERTRAVPLTHHQYPSSNMSSVPVARPVTPELDEQQQQPPVRQRQSDIYNSVSPLEMLASLGQPSGSGTTQTETSDNQSGSLTDQNKGSSSTKVPTPTDSSNPLQEQKASDDREQDNRFAALAPFISMLPRRYQIDRSIPPIIGPMNSVLFVTRSDNNNQQMSAVAIKSFGRREAWERECRALIRLKSPHVVELLEVLTIQDESRTPLPHSRHRGSESSSATTISNDEYDMSAGQKNDDDDNVKYATVLERLDETLSTVIRRARSDKNWSSRQVRAIARNVVECLAWCHSRGIAFCDLKPSNIMHRAGGPWKLIDFEASRTIGEECVGVITPRYCPPEVARATTYGLEGANGVVATPSVDLWALGCVVYELETKHALFASSIKDETILHFVSHPSPSTPILNNGLRWNEHKELYIPNLERKVPDPQARQLIRMLLSRDPAKRGSASSLLEHPYFNM